ncbi:hypothetical protein GQ464_006695 [Rhodocaloribacter litoris]|uniref:hypothetical protein n=1 Tax=Rhodocaloribacter litoris TaxID=2558931 RepID=UPI0014215FEF|nr:hypothetical protein [Rhodocaloribacter litoris]QXD16623.1 hypothetical protein GQ464_006695 [Rhodocaloribacter litoris]GIV59379.1 MAG: hypothetical protein KatS3mg043_0468 [Rhodothermaceae bacterium]
MLRLFVLGALLLPAGCATTAPPSPDLITVEGSVSRRGNEPFSALMLETDTRNLYILTIEDGPAPSFSVSYRYRVTGYVYRDTWNGRPFAHLRVVEVEPLR